MALSRFMPYGAPDLLADQDERMAKATLSAMMLLALLFAAVGTVLTHLPHAANVPDFDHVIILTPPPLIPNYSPPAQVLPSHVTPSSPHALPVPVPEAPPSVPQTQPATQGSVGSTQSGSSNGGVEVAPSGEGQVQEAPPQPGVFQYVDEMPELVHSGTVTYPDIAREAGVEGRVVVLMLVGKDGHVIEARIDPKHSVPMLDNAALEAARASVFKPALTNGHPVMVWVARPFDFRLH